MADEKKPPEIEITEEERAKIIAWLAQKAPNRRCPSCGTQKWAISQHFVTPTILGPGGNLTLGGTTYPMFFTVCVNCGKTEFYNAVLAGLSRGKKKEAGTDG